MLAGVLHVMWPGKVRNCGDEVSDGGAAGVIRHVGTGAEG